MRKILGPLASAALLLPAAASAHPAHEAGGGLAAGLLHPLLGADHLLAMLAVGLWAAQLGGAARWRVPASFVALMAAGAGLAAAGIAPPQLEAGIAASLMVLGMLVAAAGRLPLWAAMSCAGSFAVFHGAAHAAELPPSAAPLAYALGFLAATALLHAAGIGLGAWSLQRWGMIARLAGAATATAGLAYALS